MLSLPINQGLRRTIRKGMPRSRHGQKRDPHGYRDETPLDAVFLHIFQALPTPLPAAGKGVMTALVLYIVGEGAIQFIK